VLLSKGDMDGAIADFNRAIEIYPKDAAPFYNRGIARQSKGDLDGAMADFDRTIELDPQNAPAYYNRGNIKKAKGDADGAQADYDHFLKLDPVLTLSVRFDPAFTGDIAKAKEIPFVAVVKNVSKRKVNFKVSGSDWLPMNIYSLDDSGKRTQVFPKPEGAAHSGERLMSLAPGESHSFTSSMPPECFKPETRKYAASIIDFTTPDVRTTDLIEIFSEPFAPPAPQR
jgi:tetratricopeptide (TPR) repeat protein